MINSRVSIAVLLCALTLLAAGCGTSPYNVAMTKTLNELKRKAPYASLTAPTEISGTTVKISIPKILTRYITPETADAGGLKGKISAERVKFLPFESPGVYCAYDEDGEFSEGSSPMVCQIAVLPKSELNVPHAVARKFEGKKFEGQLLQIEPVEGDKKIPWWKLRVEEPMTFDVYPKDAAAPMQFKSLPGILEVWWHESDHYLVVLTWRVAKEIDDKVKLIELAPLTAGTIIVGPPPAEEKPAEAQPAEAKPAA